GKGLVGTASDFGLRSDPPTHPELLDWLADCFVADGWSVKALHRLILLSDTYRQRSDDRPECVKVDPENRLLWKFNRQRLDLQARALAARPEVADVSPPELRIDALYRRLYGRPPQADEVAMGLRLIDAASRERPEPSATTLTPWEQYAQVLLLANEFAFVD